ncbi:MAG: hypothetical protein KW793_04535 [Candidatus Doudnabacteria bacterium]|nr:hypothetical protein [Candidatus Doudnabacteria bacterium]
MASSQDYKNLINDILAKQAVILGQEIVLLKAKNVKGLSLDSEGKVKEISGNPEEVLQKLVDEYISLSGQIVKNILNPVFAKYPEIKISLP